MKHRLNKQFSCSEQKVLEELMLLRRDVRGNKFLNEEVPDEAIDQILHAASLAPSVGFSQPWEFVVVRDNKTRQSIVDNFNRENDKAEKQFSGQKRQQYSKLKLEGIQQAPVNIAVFYKPSQAPVLGQNSIPEVGEYSVVCAVQNMWLMSRALNIGLGWVSILDADAVKNTLKVPDSYKLIAYLCLGYVDEFLDAPELEILQWEQRKPIHDVVHYDCFKDD